MRPALRILLIIIATLVFAIAGYIVGQFAPFTGLATIAEPFSPVRNSTANGYAVIAGIIGLIIGLAAKHGKGSDDEALKDKG